MNKRMLLSIIVFLIVILSNSVVFACENKNDIEIANEGEALKKQIINSEETIIEEIVIVDKDDNYRYLESKIKEIQGYVVYGEELRNTILEALINLQDTVDLSKFFTNINQINIDEISDFYFNILYENPEIFYSDNYINISYSYFPSSGEIVKCDMNISYLESKETINEMKKELNNKIDEIQKGYLNGIDDKLQLEYIIHDYILDNTTYKMGSQIVHTAYGALVNGEAVCEGYAKAAKLLFNLVGIQSGIIISPEMNHAWNYVKINDKYYHFDVTWNDPIPETNRIRYNYFNRSDEEMSETHKWNNNLYPECINEDFKFLRSYNDEDIARNGDRLYFCESGSDYNNIYSSSLNGQAKKIEISEIKANNFISYNNDLYFVDKTRYYESKIVKYNITTKEIVEMYETEEQIYSIYIKDEILYVEDWDSQITAIEIKLNEDVNEDGIIDIKDLAIISLEYSQNKTSIEWNKIYDLNLDNIIDIYDLILVARKIK